MKIYKDIKRHKSKIISSINKFGFLPEHNYYHHLYKQTPHKRCIFVDFGQKKGLLAVFNKNNNVWHVTNGILALPDGAANIFLKFVDYALLKKKAKKIVVEADEELKSKFLQKLKSTGYVVRMNYALYWPVYDLQEWDKKLSGKKWKKFRNIRNRFYNHLLIKVKDPRKIDKNTLKGVLSSWLKRRHPRDIVDYSYYLNVFGNKLKGFDMARALSINNELCSISAGWKVPNSDKFYCGIGIFNYKYKDMGDFVNLDDLIYLKKKGFKHVDLGGSDKAMLCFKKKFRPKKIYKTFIFSIARKK